MVHLYTLFMVTPIFNTLMRIDRSLIEAARDAGASAFQILWNVILPLAKPGMAIGTIFVVTLVMADFSTVQVMSGGQSASVALMMKNQMSLLQYPGAAANAVVLLILVLLMVGAHPPRRRYPQGALSDDRREAHHRLLRARSVLRALRAVPLWPDVGDLDPQLPGAERRADLPAQRRVAPLVRQSLRAAGGRRFRRELLALADRSG